MSKAVKEAQEFADNPVNQERVKTLVDILSREELQHIGANENNLAMIAELESSEENKFLVITYLRTCRRMGMIILLADDKMVALLKENKELKDENAALRIKLIPDSL